MTSTKKITNSSNSSDNEKDFLEEEFLKLKIEDIPIPKAGLEDYELDIQEVMKSGCNRQIAEYVIEGIKKLEESQDNKSKKLIDLRKEYRNIIKKAIEDTINDLDDHITNKKTTYGDRELDDYDDEIDEILNSDKIQKAKNANDDLNLENIEKIAKYYLDENLKKIDKGNLEEKKKNIMKKEKLIYKLH